MGKEDDGFAVGSSEGWFVGITLSDGTEVNWLGAFVDGYTVGDDVGGQ